MREKQDFVFRIKEDIQLNRKKSLKDIRPNGSNVTADFTYTIGTAQKRHRVVQFIDHEGKEIRVATSLLTLTAKEIAGMYKSRWAIETFFRWIKQNLNVPVLVSTTKNAVFNQLFAALIAYVLLKWLHINIQKQIQSKSLSLIGFQRLLLCDALPLKWRIALKEIIESHRSIHERNV